MDESHAELALDQLELELHLPAQLEVERSERLVEQQHPRPVHERAGESDPLLLAARELARLAGFEAGEIDELEDLPHAPTDVVPTDPRAAHAEGDVLEDREVWKERVALEDRVHIALVGRKPEHALAAEKNRSFGGLLEAADHSQRRRLPAAGGPEEGEEAAGRDLDRHIVDRDHVVEALGDALEPYVGRLGGNYGGLLDLLADRHPSQSSLTMTCLTCV
jgi:hypothetical protein